MLGLGGWPVVSLALARQQALENRLALHQGRDLLAERRAAKKKANVPTFREAAEQTMAAEAGGWKGGANGTTARHWLQGFERRGFPEFGDRPIDSIHREDMLELLQPIWQTVPVEAQKLRRRCRTVFEWARAMRHIDRNPAGSVLKPLLPKASAKQKHLRSLPYSEVGPALETIEAAEAGWSAKWCLRLVVLTAVRSGEARMARWDEVDFEAREWSIPGDRTKTGREHRVPLSEAALAVFEQAKVLEDGSSLCFPSPRKKGAALSDMALTAVLRRTGLASACTVHGFRSSFRVFASERTNAAHAVMELCLAHQVGSKVEQAYARSDLLAKRRQLMNRWSTYLTDERANVVALHA